LTHTKAVGIRGLKGYKQPCI